MNADIVLINDDEIEKLARDIKEAKDTILGNLTSRGYNILAGKAVNGKTSGEVPYAMGNLQAGVVQEPIDYETMTGTLTVSARTGNRGPRTAEVFGADGKKRKTVSLRPQPAYDYAEVVARGSRHATLTPSRAKAFMIPVPTAPTGESYLVSGGQTFIFRRSRKGQKANPYDERTAKRLEEEAPKIADAVLKDYFV